MSDQLPEVRRGLFLVEVIETRKTSVYVQADDRRDAREDAIELTTGPGVDWDVEDTDTITYEVGSAPAGERYWSGGEGGDWVRASGGAQA